MKPECNHIRQLLSEYIDGLLETTELTEVSKHLHVCQDCSREHETLKSLIRTLGNIRPVKAPDNLLEKIHVRVKNDSIFNRIRDAFSFTHIRLPIELAAFAATVILIISFLNLFPSEEKGIIKMPENPQLTMDKGASPAQLADGQSQAGHPVSIISSEGEKKVQQVPVKMALTLNTEQGAVPIPSQSVSFGNTGAAYTNDNPDTWASGNDSSREKILPDEINAKIDDMIKAVGGKILSREDNTETGYPSRLTLDIPRINYQRFILKTRTLGDLHSLPVLPEDAEGSGVLVQMELTTP